MLGSACLVGPRVVATSRHTFERDDVYSDDAKSLESPNQFQVLFNTGSHPFLCDDYQAYNIVRLHDMLSHDTDSDSEEDSSDGSFKKSFGDFIYTPRGFSGLTDLILLELDRDVEGIEPAALATFPKAPDSLRYTSYGSSGHVTQGGLSKTDRRNAMLTAQVTKFMCEAHTSSTDHSLHEDREIYLKRFQNVPSLAPSLPEDPSSQVALLAQYFPHPFKTALFPLENAKLYAFELEMKVEYFHGKREFGSIPFSGKEICFYTKDITSSPGDSGCPILVNENGVEKVVAFHVGSGFSCQIGPLTQEENDNISDDCSPAQARAQTHQKLFQMWQEGENKFLTTALAINDNLLYWINQVNEKVALSPASESLTDKVDSGA